MSLHLPEPEADQVRCYLSYLLQAFHLEEWTVILSAQPTKTDDPEHPAPAAEVHTEKERHCAVLQLSPQWGKWSDELRGEILIHEVLHLITWPALRRNDLWNHSLPKSLRMLAYLDSRNEEELLVDRLAGILASLLPQYPGPLSVPIPNVKRDGEWC